MHGLKELRVIDHSNEIAGPYCSKLFADAGADVIKLEVPGGDPLRAWSVTGNDLGGQDGALFRYLNASKRSVIGLLDETAREGDGDGSDALIASADLLIEDLPPGAYDRPALLERHPGLVILSITPFGLTGPMAERPATDFTIQAESGSISSRARPGGEPFLAGGRIGAWTGGCFAAAAALAAIRRAQATGHGEHIDFSLHDVTALVTNCYLDLMWGILGRPPAEGAFAYIETPSVEPSSDGFVGFTTYSAQQLSDFLLLIERPDLRESGEFDLIPERLARLEEWESIVHAYTQTHTTDEIVELAQVLRIPVAPVSNGQTVLDQEQLKARGSFIEDPSGDFKRPVPPYRMDGAAPDPPRPAPRLGEHGGQIEAHEPRRPRPGGARKLPLEGMRIIDTTSWWAGPIATHMLAMLGADVIHVESIQKIDGSRSIGGTFAAMHEDWWECSFIFLSANSNKRGITLDLSNPRGMAIFDSLIAGADALVENFSPRVMDGFGVTWEKVQALNPRCHYVRMPAFGLDGPWREHVGFAATMEQMAGMSWLTGHVDDQPRIQRGPCDPLAGMHAVFALLVAMAERDHTGRGHFIECAMIEGALNATAEQVIEYTAYGNLMQRQGNRSPEAAPQGLYPCSGHHISENPQWLALSVATETQWEALLDWLGRPDWATQVGADLLSRRSHQDKLDEGLRRVFAERERDVCVDELIAAGVPAAPLVDPRTLTAHPQCVARGFLEEVDHPIVGRQTTMGAPFRFASTDHWLERAAPLLGQHNADILRELGHDQAEIDELIAEKVIGERPEGL
ncbi:MAG: CoA transferase [Deltaproteobacteria bacterium]|nr:CoA transferase [Deltaproteobacteria bacterium]MBW2361991.1 CoA transferase [Deltaproteobacteria bacterium]